jgi:hypothetical protein
MVVAYDKSLRPPDIDPPPLRSTASSTPALSPGFFSAPEARKTAPNQLRRADAVAKSHTSGEQRVADAKSCFAKFKKQLEPAATLPEDHRHKLLMDACQDCRPKLADTGEFSLLVRRYLSATKHNRAAWADRQIVSCLNTPSLRFPRIESPGAREMLMSLEKMSLAPPDGIRSMRQLYTKYAKQVTRDPGTSTSADQDRNLRLLIRGLWDTCSSHTPKSVQSRGDMIPAPARDVLHILGQRLSDPHLRTHVCSILSDPTSAASHIQTLVLACASNPALKPLGVNVLEHIPRRLLNAWMGHLQNKLLEPEATASDMATRSPRFETWLSMLRMLGRQATSAASVPDLALRSLVTLFTDQHRSRTPPDAVATALLYVLAGHKSMVGISPDRVTSLARSFRGARGGKHAADRCLNDMLATLVLDLGEASLPNHGVLELMVPLLDQVAGLKSVLDLLKRVQSSGTTLSQTAFLEDYFAHRVHRVSQVDTSSERKRQHVALALRTCQHIQQLLVDLTAGVDAQADALGRLQSRRQFEYITHRARDAGVAPLAFRNITTDLSRSTQTELIHQFAHQYSLDRTRNHRQNWRSIYYLYRYMRQHGLEIGPLFSKAVLRVCITQPLSESQFVSSRRLKWVCELVARVEGVDAAKKIEHMFWVWRGDLILHAKSTLKAAGVGGRVHVSTLKRLGMI